MVAGDLGEEAPATCLIHNGQVGLWGAWKRGSAQEQRSEAGHHGGKPAGNAAGRPSLPLQKVITPRTFKTISGLGPDGNRHDSAVLRRGPGDAGR